jgi:hypothetical protein
VLAGLLNLAAGLRPPARPRLVSVAS